MNPSIRFAVTVGERHKAISQLRPLYISVLDVDELAVERPRLTLTQPSCVEPVQQRPKLPLSQSDVAGTPPTALTAGTQALAPVLPEVTAPVIAQPASLHHDEASRKAHCDDTAKAFQLGLLGRLTKGMSATDKVSAADQFLDSFIQSLDSSHLLHNDVLHRLGTELARMKSPWQTVVDVVETFNSRAKAHVTSPDFRRLVEARKRDPRGRDPKGIEVGEKQLAVLLVAQQVKKELDPALAEGVRLQAGKAVDEACKLMIDKWQAPVADLFAVTDADLKNPGFRAFAFKMGIVLPTHL